MTAEISILNRTAVAMAADSAVTSYSEGPEGKREKVFQSAEKLFALSKHHPVGIMVYGSADLNGIPWETIIKDFRRRNRKAGFDSVHEWTQAFVKFLESDTDTLGQMSQDSFVESRARMILVWVRDQIDKKVREALESPESSVSDSDLPDIADRVIGKIAEQVAGCETLPAIDLSFESRLEKSYSEIVNALVDEIFEKYPLSAASRAGACGLPSAMLVRKDFPFSSSGLVVAGFGMKESFPALVDLKGIRGCLLGKLLFSEERRLGVTLENRCLVYPTAQTDMVYTFMEGINPSLETILLDNVRSMFTEEFALGAASHFVASLQEVLGAREFDYPAFQAKLQQGLQRKCTEVVDRLKEDFHHYKQWRFVDSIVQTVSFLPKDELAALAETLVNLTKVKRRVSLESETVGGPVDVAVISKGDGFIWVNRKHYFKAELNHHYFAGLDREPLQERTND